ARLALLGAQVLVPLPGQGELAGLICLGARAAQETYTERDLESLIVIAELAAAAIQRAQIVEDLERQVNQLHVMTRLAEGLNITSAFDDILELIYTQANQGIPTQDFFITLSGETGFNTSHAFYLQKNERLLEQENRPISERHDLSLEVIRTGNSIITDDYGRECRQRAYLPAVEGLYSWMAAPLLTSNATIGAISLGSRDPAILYTDTQLELLESIADQAAGAIAKARLLHDAERRAAQLTVLNDVARSMSSTLDIDPLLDQILQSAVDLLDCEAGSLLMVDESNGDLVFQVATGPVASSLLGRRLPAGTGLAGKVAEAGQPVIANTVSESSDWFSETDADTGFSTQSVLALPLQAKEKIIGVIEVINKRDGSPFNAEEQELLTVFTGQAAVAIENARLYTLTDRELAARVEELSVLQRIDRELNASLDIKRTMEITLDWSLKQSDSDAGLIGTAEDGSLYVLASAGYKALDNRDLRAHGLIAAALSSGSAQVDVGGGEETLLPGALSRTVIPVRREEEVIGILLLESGEADHYPPEKLRFLSRLSDHAAIAISNAQLYQEVQEANLAKSDFVSFVSHELKTPMTSIKGYTDLLSAGSVGPVSDAQANFLSTIRSNVDRMATLVSDLADISRIEVGKLRLEFGTVSVADLVDEVVRSTRRQVEEKNQTLTVDMEDEGLEAWGDRTRLIQVLTNLVSNANKYTPADGKIWIRAGTSAEEGDLPVVHIAVEDDGIGISDEDQKQIFQKFFRSDDQKAREAPGTGLGLNITKSLVEMQGGEIWFESEYRKGTTFHFTIPISDQ
ncbi:MAG: GAF domain-containing protein, partial [Anaerolineales bacterium]|nr:GAF domain-containing protein [Anaerolineales bacterium]